jgi:transposase
MTGVEPESDEYASPALEEAPMADSSVWYVGIDLHKDWVVVSALRGASNEPQHEQTLPNQWPKLKRYFERLLKDGAVRACYEAGGCGYGLQRRLSALGVECSVIAPSHTPTQPGDRRKTDQRDARKLARFLRSGDLVAVHVPAPEEEAVRDLVRSRLVLVQEIHRSRQYVLKLVQRLGRRFEGGRNWTQQHRQWLASLELGAEHRRVLDRYLALLAGKELLLAEIEQDVERASEQAPYAEPVARLRCLHGIDTTSAMVLVTEAVDARRFASARDFMGWVGLTVSESSSGGPGRQSMGGITKTGNARCRFVLGEAAWSYARPSRHSRKLLARQKGRPAHEVAFAQRAQRRLHRRFEALAARKHRTVAATAVARELAGFVWALLRGEKELLLPRAGV